MKLRHYQTAATRSGGALNGFSVALVEGFLIADPLRAATTMPAVWSRALNDMKDFLPYSQYRLVDSQWVLGSGRLAVQLTGPDETYSLRMQTAFPYYGGRIGGARGAVETAPRVSVSSFQLTTGVVGDRMSDLMRRLEEARLRQDSGRGSAAEVQRAEQEVASAPRGVAQPWGRPLIDTSFTMDVGETVVVGTSRVNGDRAIIVLLTAVAKR